MGVMPAFALKDIYGEWALLQKGICYNGKQNYEFMRVMIVYSLSILTLLTYPLLIFQQLCPFNRDKISSFLIRVLKFHDFYLDNTIYKMAWKKKWKKKNNWVIASLIFFHKTGNKNLVKKNINTVLL